MSEDLPDLSTLPCPAWVFSYGSNTHIAKDRYWFGIDYRPITSTVTDGPGGSTVAVIGIGTVNLPLKTKPDDRHPGNSIMTLRNVLHAPDSLCNMIGAPAIHYYEFSLRAGPGFRGTISLGDGTPVGFFAPHAVFFEVQLSDPPIGPIVGPSPFTPGVFYWINATWSTEEREKWMHGREEVAERLLRGRLQCLRSFCKSICKGEDRERGTRLLRVMTRDDDENDFGIGYQ
ncbi:hypothetical protein BM221_006109 [Beauveria bassiana]|uniref:Retrovirus-related Pol polyprotein from transposon TNT 1-94-like beta-barrel domain-containing protein n=1 Tax=Beauveria bassiana TaxID=176275 RepID=A0A2N6NL03_BEABA|nr:hypothetical protein BM221_006109 [Beauveria bassiana]